MHKEAKFSGVQFPLQKHNQNQRKTLRCNLSSSPVRRSGCCLRTLGGSLNSHFPEKSHKLYPRGGEVQGSPDSGKYLRECTACQGGNESFNIFFLWLTFFQIPQTPAFMAGFERPKKNWLFALVTAKKITPACPAGGQLGDLLKRPHAKFGPNRTPEGVLRTLKQESDQVYMKMTIVPPVPHNPSPAAKWAHWFRGTGIVRSMGMGQGRYGRGGAMIRRYGFQMGFKNARAAYVHAYIYMYAHMCCFIIRLGCILYFPMMFTSIVNIIVNGHKFYCSCQRHEQ